MDFLSSLNSAHILIAESNPDDMALLATTLQDAGYNVQKAYYAGDALFAIEHGQFDLALINVSIADRDQMPLVERLTTLPRAALLRWIALVGEQDDKPQRFLRQGAAAYLTHPVAPRILLRQVENVLGGEEPLPNDTKTDSQNVNPILKRKLKEQQTLSALVRSLSAVLDLDALLTQVVDAAVSLCNAEEGLLLLPDREEQVLYVRAVKGIDRETARNFRIKTKDTLAGQVFRTGQPILIGDQGWQKVKTEYLVKSLLYVPMSSKGETIGVLGVNNKNTDRTFTEDDTELLQDLAAHAAIAIENARLYEQSVLRTRELSTLVEAGEAVNSTLALDRVLSIIAGQMISTLNVHQCYIGEWSPQSAELRTLALRYRTLWQSGEGPVLSLKQNPAIEQAFNRRRPVLLPLNRQHAEHPLAAWLPHTYTAQGMVHMPLFSQDYLLGMITLYHIHRPSPERSYPFAAQIQQLAMEAAVDLADSSIEKHQQSLFRVVHQILDRAGADWCEMALWDVGLRQFNTLISYGEAIWPETPKPALDLARFPLLERVLSEGRAFTSAAEDFSFLSQPCRGKSFLGVPLVIKGAVGGLVILTDTLYERNFSRRELELAQALVSQAANALDNARLFRNLELSLEELHRTQSKLVQTARLSAMGELAAAVAHQINNPLTTILGDTELILQDLPQTDANYEALEAISRAGKRAHEVVRRLLTMARQAPFEEALEPLDVNETINNTLTLVKSHIQQGSVSLSVDLTDNLPPVIGVQGLLEDVWLNLLLNARDAVADRSPAEIGIATTYQPDEEQIEIIVWDNGIGIPEEQQAQIFEPFFTTKSIGEGTGLGLHICGQAVEKCQGSIRVESHYNEGTRFIVRLPIYDR